MYRKALNNWPLDKFTISLHSLGSRCCTLLRADRPGNIENYITSFPRYVFK